MKIENLKFIKIIPPQAVPQIFNLKATSKNRFFEAKNFT